MPASLLLSLFEERRVFLSGSSSFRTSKVQFPNFRCISMPPADNYMLGLFITGQTSRDKCSRSQRRNEKIISSQKRAIEAGLKQIALKGKK